MGWATNYGNFIGNLAHPHDQGAEIGGEHRLPTTEAHAHGAAGDVSHHETRVDDGHLRMLWMAGWDGDFGGRLRLKKRGWKWCVKHCKATISMGDLIFKGVFGRWYICWFAIPGVWVFFFLTAMRQQQQQTQEVNQEGERVGFHDTSTWQLVTVI